MIFLTRTKTLKILFLCLAFEIFLADVKVDDSSDIQYAHCGVANKYYRRKRIVGGERTTINKYPWMVGLGTRKLILCGAVVLNHCFLLSSAHCFKWYEDTSQITAVFGTDHVNNPAAVTRHISQFIRYPEYVRNATHHDIMVLKLSEPIKFNDHIRPICLPQENETYVGKFATVTGFGYTSFENATLSRFLREIDLKIISNEDCQKAFHNHTIYETNLCAGGEEGRDACLGDSGGPFFRLENNVYTIIGTVSWGYKCGQKGIPGLYTRVNAYLPWILNVTANSDCGVNSTSNNSHLL